MTDQNQKNETDIVGEELFIDQLGQVRGGIIDIRSISDATYEVEYGVKPPTFPGSEPKTRPVHFTDGLLENLPFPLPRL